MKKSMTLWQRAVAMVLALQMTAAPVAMARANNLLFVSITGEQAMLTSASTAEVADTGAEPETGSEPETGAADPTYQLDKDAEQYFVDANASLLNTGTGTIAYASNVTVGLSMGIPNGEEMLERFYDEDTGLYLYGAEFGKDNGNNIYWGYRDDLNGAKALNAATDGTSYYFYLPSDNEIGRVPDLEFNGFYNFKPYKAEGLTWDGVNFTEYSIPAKDWSSEGLSFDNGGELTEVDPTAVNIDWNGKPPNNDNETGALVYVPADALMWTEWEDLDAFWKGIYPTKEEWEAVRETMDTATIPVIAKWKDSTIARFTDFGFTWTDDDSQTTTETRIYTMAASEDGPLTVPSITVEQMLDLMDGIDIGVAGIEEEGPVDSFFLQVTSDVKALDLSFVSYEPYWGYHKKGAVCPVTVKVGRDGGELEALTLDPDNGFTSEMLAVRTNSAQSQVNTVENPARAQWALPKIELTAEVTTVEITLTAPDKTTTRTVTFQIRKLADPILTKAPGNTPFGMIDRDTATVWGETDEAIEENKANAKTSFANTHQFDTDYFPKDNVYHQGGEIFKGIYSSAMWEDLPGYQYDYVDKTWSYEATGNLDLRSDAIVVYQDTVVLDPGVTLTASRGETDIVPLKDMTAKVTVLVATGALIPDLVGAKAGTAGVEALEVELKLTTDEKNRTIDLRGKKVLPGVYSIEYSYDDWYIGQIVDSTNTAVFSNPDLAANFSRPLIVLPTPGDVDMDGAVTHADAMALEDYLASGYDVSDPAVALFLFRVCDVTHDGQVNTDDVAKLEGGFHPEVHKPDGGGSSDYWYIPLPDGGTEVYTRRTWSDLGVNDGAETASLMSQYRAEFYAVETTGATISLEYLGVEQGSAQSDGTTLGAAGPWRADPDSEVALGAYNSEENAGKNQGEVFWMGVNLSGVEQSLLNGKEVDSLTLTVTYDDRYVEPAYVVPNGESGWDVVAGKTDMEKWKYSVTRYNLGGLSDGKTLWGEDADYTLTAATAYDLNYTTHYSKVMSDLEQELGAGNEHLRQLTFSVSLTDGRTAVTLKDGYLVALPFRLVKHPFGENVLQAVELSAGMRELTLVSRTTVGGVSTTDTAAYSAQNAIFGDSTQNLRSQPTQTDGVTYADVLASIPLGTNNTNATPLPTAIYGEGLDYGGKEDIPFGGTGVSDESVLPPGLRYTAEGHLVGTPTQAGSYEFEISGELFHLVVEKKKIDCTVNSADTYYGESDHRDVGSGDFTFTYDVSDLYADDVARATDNGIVLEGNGEELKKLFEEIKEEEYTAPTFTAKVGGSNSAVQEKTPVNENGYVIEPQTVGVLANYELKFPTTSSAKLTIHPRPVVADALGTLYVGEIYLDSSASVSGTDEAAKGKILSAPGTNAGGAGLFTLAWPKSHEYVAAISGDPLVGGDSLTISYTATWSQVTSDLGQETTFTLTTGSREYRPIALSALKLGGTSASNYVLVENTPSQNYDVDTYEGVFDVTVEAEDGGPEGYSGPYGIVARRKVVDITIRDLPTHFTEGVAYTYGENLFGTRDLWFDILMDGDDRHGTYRFTPDIVRDWQLHVNFVTVDEKNADTSKDPYAGTGRDEDGNDMNPYYEGVVLTHSGHDGRYLCVSVDVPQDDGSIIVIRTYSEVPIRVEPRTLTLTAQKLTRFYGEGNDGLTYTYNPSELATRDRNLLGGVEKGTAEELEALMIKIGGEGYYTEPEMNVLTTGGDRVEKDTAAGTACKIWISDAATEDGNYIFRYANSGVTGGYSDKEGVADLEILKRRVVVDDLTALGEQRVLAEVRLYTDTMDITTKNIINETNDGGPLKLTLDEVSIVAPDKSGDSILYWSSGTVVSYRELKYPMTGDAILTGDKLELTYTATVVPDSGQWLNFGAGYFETADWSGNSEKYPVQVGDLALIGEAADNYELVYKKAETAQRRVPTNVGYESAPADDGTGPMIYYTSAEAWVYRRPVDSLFISGRPIMSYTSGDTFNPASGLTVKVQYSKAYDNRPDINVTSETVTYDYSGYVGDVLQTTFDERGFTIGYLKSGESTALINDAFLAAREIDQSTELTRVEHHGARLFVAGTDSEGDTIVSTPTTETLTVSPRTLTLTVNDIHRFYGEPNHSSVTVLAGTTAELKNAQGFTFSFDESQLSPADRAKLAAASPALTGRNGADALEALGLNFKAPTYYTTAEEDSDAAERGRPYPITASGGSLDNYTLSWVSGNVYVYPRVVRVDHFDSSDEWPIYTIYSDMNIQTLTTEIPRVEEVYKTVNDVTVEDTRERVFFTMPPTVSYYTQEAANGVEYDLPLTGTAIYGYDADNVGSGDDLTIKATVKYPINELPEGDAIRYYDVTLENLSIATGSDNSQNYCLWGTSAIDASSRGAVALRRMVSVRVVQAPRRMEYTYGENLSLAGLAVEITYGMLDNPEDTTREKVTVSYNGPDQFKSYGLYVDYSTSATVEDNAAIWRDIITNGRSADTGDHVTIAPSHDYYKNEEFAHNGKYLVISGQLDEEHTPVKPVIVTEIFGSGATLTYGKAIPIKVNPLKLTFTLSAQDKTYDGNTAAAGTLTLTNVYDREGYVDAYNTNVTDVVFVRTGAAYEDPGVDDPTHNDYTAFKEHVRANGYAFTTGTYAVNDPWPLGANGKITWVASNYYESLMGRPGYLTFNFVNADVRYEDGAYWDAVASVTQYGDYWRTDQAANTPGGTWDTFGTVAAMPVEVTGMVLAGPDAANYTWEWAETDPKWVDETSVLMSTRDSAEDGQDAVPFATIHKANRQTIWDAAVDTMTPTVAVDRHTNVVQLTWEQDVAKMEGESATYTGETHFEYALLYVDSNGELRQWAGNDGTAGWQDTLYFGGEFVDPGVPGGYVPDPDDLPTAEDVAEEDYVFKGQLYRWDDQDDGVWIEGAFYPNDTVQLGYYLLASKRAPLPRNTVFWPIVRVAETHNYLSSPVLSGDATLTARLIDDWMKAKAAYNADPTPDNEDAVKLAADAVIAQLTDTDAAARKAADDEVTYVKGLAAENDWPEDNIWTDPAPTAAVKTFRERIDVISVEETESFVETDETEYRVPTLEAVWFTDLMEYPEESYMDVVLRNNEPIRYYGYYWDRWMSAQMEFDEEAPIDLSGPISGIEVTYDDENGDKVETTITVNENGTLKLYVNITSGGGVPIRDFFVEPSYIVARVGDEPIELTVTFIPENATHTRLNWLTSDPTVATVKYGVVTIVGPGTATITAVTQNGHRREIQVLVLSAEQLWGGIFNWGYTDAWFDLEKDGLFHPLREMTRGEVAWTLAKLYVPSETWTRSGPSYFSDLTGEEYYYDAAILLGSEGVILGMPGGEFQGEKTITRGEFAAMLARMMDLPMPDPLNSKAIYSDVEVGEHWAWAYIHAISAVGGMHGVGDGQFAPDAILTRAEAATVISRLLHKQIDMDRSDWWVPLDVSEPDWFYWYVVRAVNNIGAVSDLVE